MSSRSVLVTADEEKSKSSLWNTDLVTVKATSSKPHVCKFCALTFTREKALISHERMHMGDQWQSDQNSLTCKNCDKIFLEQSMLEQHFIKCIQKVQTVTKKRGSSSLASHTKQFSTSEPPSVPPSIKRVHACTQCPKSFSTKQKLYRHMWIHRSLKFSCEVCAISFSEQLQLDEHR